MKLIYIAIFAVLFCACRKNSRHADSAVLWVSAVNHNQHLTVTDTSDGATVVFDVDAGDTLIEYLNPAGYAIFIYGVGSVYSDTLRLSAGDTAKYTIVE